MWQASFEAAANVTMYSSEFDVHELISSQHIILRFILRTATGMFWHMLREQL